MLQTRRRALRRTGVAAAVLVITACSSTATNHSTGTTVVSQPRTAVVAQRTVPYTATATCAPISQTVSRRVLVCAGTSTVDGNIAAVATITLHGLHGTDTSIEYDANGARMVKETFTAAVSANGTITLTGHGICTGGTGVHKHEKCTYTLTGMTKPHANVSTSKEVGTTTR